MTQANLNQMSDDLNAVRILLVRLGAEIYRMKANPVAAIGELKAEYEALAIEAAGSSDNIAVFTTVANLVGLVEEIAQEVSAK